MDNNKKDIKEFIKDDPETLQIMGEWFELSGMAYKNLSSAGYTNAEIFAQFRSVFNTKNARLFII